MSLLLPLVATVMVACSAPSAGGNAAKIESIDPAIWALSDEDTTVYLFGTVHMLKPETLWFDDEVKAAFDRSDTLVLEVTEEDPAKMAGIVARLAANTEGPPTSELLPPRARERYFAALKSYNIPAAAMDRIDPWLVSINLSIAPLMRLGYRQDLGVEKILETEAAKAGKPMIGLETTEQQLGYFDGLPMKVQVAYLKSTVDDLPDVKKDFAELLRNWSHGNPEALARQMNKSLRETPEMAKILLHDRNERWTAWIEQRMGEHQGTIFVAVGAGHLAGKDSVIELLEKRKWKVRRLSKKDFGLD